MVVLDGGRTALTEAPRQATSATARLRLEPGAGPVGLTDRSARKASFDTVQIFDARTAEEFRGDVTAHLSQSDLLDGTHLKGAAEIADLISDPGLDGSRPIVSHCNGGGRAAPTALAAVVAAARDVRVY